MSAVPILVNVILALIIITAGLVDRHAQNTAWNRIADERRSLRHREGPRGGGGGRLARSGRTGV